MTSKRGSKEDNWYEFKNKYLDSLLEERLVSYLDPGAEEILYKINSLENVVTTSSCIGRITIVEAEFPWERREDSRIVLKTHSKVDEFKIALVLSRDLAPLWLKVTGPIIHFRIKNFECASALLNIARRSGFKHSGIISIDERGPSCCTVEINSPTQMIVPLKTKKKVLIRGNDLKVLVLLANEILFEGRKRLRNLVSNIDSIKDFCS